jgi:hypothetical protein
LLPKSTWAATHWSVDNYGSKDTPALGGVINAFQGHHKYPWTITKRQFANNIHTTCPATMCATVPLLLLPGGAVRNLNPVDPQA